MDFEKVLQGSLNRQTNIANHRIYNTKTRDIFYSELII
jgi:hypothetical protein